MKDEYIPLLEAVGTLIKAANEITTTQLLPLITLPMLALARQPGIDIDVLISDIDLVSKSEFPGVEAETLKQFSESLTGMLREIQRTKP
jgi:hypothetical protein